MTLEIYVLLNIERVFRKYLKVVVGTEKEPALALSLKRLIQAENISSSKAIQHTTYSSRTVHVTTIAPYGHVLFSFDMQSLPNIHFN